MRWITVMLLTLWCVCLPATSVEASSSKDSMQKAMDRINLRRVEFGVEGRLWNTSSASKPLVSVLTVPMLQFGVSYDIYHFTGGAYIHWGLNTDSFFLEGDVGAAFSIRPVRWFGWEVGVAVGGAAFSNLTVRPFSRLMFLIPLSKKHERYLRIYGGYEARFAFSIFRFLDNPLHYENTHGFWFGLSYSN